jgi:para-aminobenzoate synthetase/4-amino-4-deoxychorismate lyase
MPIFALSETDLKNILKDKLSSPFVFLETASFDKENKTSFLFQDFHKILTFKAGDNVDLFFKGIEDFVKKGFWLCGYFAYEFGYFLEPAFHALRQKSAYPLAWFGVCRKPTLINQSYHQPNFKNADLFYAVKNIKPNICQREYAAKISRIKDYLKEGLTYQVNFTFKVKFDFRGDVLDFYLNLRKSQPTSYMALINMGESFILSLSPELFFRREGKTIVTRPMKGTSGRGLTWDGDKKNQEELKKNAKIKAENVMIVDLLRNDLGRIAQKVWVPRLFQVEKYRTLYQMTSTIKAKLFKSDVKIKDIFTSLFPCGSVTGAPKIKTMDIIRSLEKEPRGIYTGAIGYISPEKEACFNVAIRTILLNQGKGEMGIGGGIVDDSVEKYEYEEALLKAKFLVEKFPQFSLIETILWQENKGYFLLDLHLERLKNSCDYFSISLDFKKLKKNLKIAQANMNQGKWKVRILVNPLGQVSIERQPLEELNTPVRVKISAQRINPGNVFLYHKTTRRHIYDRENRRARRQGFFEVIFLNINGQVTEGAISNIFILKQGRLYTPPVKCGLLEGVLRKHLLREGKVEEKIIYPKDILDADKWYIGNSVRGLMEARL